MSSPRPPRILLAKPGLDGHDRGVLIVAAALRDAGFEVIYTGLRQSAEMIAAAAEEEDVDFVGLSSLSGAHNTQVPKVIEELKRRGMPDLPVVVGGIVPEADRAALKQAGVAGVFGPGTPSQEIVEFLRKLFADQSQGEQS